MRYQRGYQGFLRDGEGGAETLSLLLAYGLRPPGGDSPSARNPDPSLAFKGGLVATRLRLSGSAPSDYRPGFAFGGSYSPFRLGSWIALMPHVELSFVRRKAAETGPADSSLAMDSIDLSVLARGELVASGRTVYGIGGIYGSLLFDAQRHHEGRITDMGDTLSSVDAGWIVGAGIELFSIAAVKPAVELRYQRGFRNLVPAGPGEVLGMRGDDHPAVYGARVRALVRRARRSARTGPVRTRPQQLGRTACRMGVLRRSWDW